MTTEGMLVTTTTENSVSALLAERAAVAPDDTAFTFIDYEADPQGYEESLTWAELHHQAQVVAAKLAPCGTPGDRVVILAPQSLEYVVGYFGAIHAGFIAVPLSVPQLGQHDERVTGALADCAAVAVLTTSAVADQIKPYLQAGDAARAPKVIEVDSLDLDTPVDVPATHHRIAYLQYTSGSTRRPAGVVITHENVLVNVAQLVTDYFEDHQGLSLDRTTVVSWLPLYHDMGLVVGLFIPLRYGRPGVLMSPTAFMQRPARWMQQLARSEHAFTAAPNFAFELAAQRTSDADLDGSDLGDVAVMINGAERVHGSTLRRFAQRFEAHRLPPVAVRPSYGLAEVTVYVSAANGGGPATVVRLDLEKLAAGHAERADEGGSELVSCGTPRCCDVRVVDPESMRELSAGMVGEVWVHGPQVAAGYWRNPELTEQVFAGRLTDPAAGTPAGLWLRTGDLGVMFEGELFIIGRIKDLLIVDGRNIYPDDLEATIAQFTGGRTAAISVPGDTGETLVAMAELRAGSDLGANELDELSRKITAAVSKSHSVRVADVVLLPQRSLPLTTSGKVRRASCVAMYQTDRFDRLVGSR